MSVKHFTNSAEFDSAIQTAPVAMVDFWATWCGPCKMLAPVIEDIGAKYDGKAVVAKVDVDENQALAAKYDGKAVVAKVDVDENQSLAAKYGVMSIPTVIFFKDGKEIGRKVGVQPASVYTQTLDANL